MQQVYRNNLSIISDLKAVVEDFNECIDPAIIRKAFASANTWLKIMIKQNGGRFEHETSAL